jgi:hypothetical protein
MVSGATTDGDADAEAGWVEGREESGPVEFAGTEALREEHAAPSSPTVSIINTIRRISSPLVNGCFDERRYESAGGTRIGAAHSL